MFAERSSEPFFDGRSGWEMDGAPQHSTQAAAFGTPEMFSPLFPVLLLAAVAASRLRRHQRASGHVVRRSHSDEMPPEYAGWQLAETLFCPVCFGEFLAGTEDCEDCGVPLVDEEALPAAATHIEEGVVRIASIRNATQGHLIRTYFSSNHIPCTLARCSPCDVFGTDIYVFESDALRAKRLLRHLQY